MGDTMTATPPLILYYRRRLVNVANHLSDLTKIAQKTVGIPILVHDLLLDSTKQVIRAYQELPDK